MESDDLVKVAIYSYLLLIFIHFEICFISFIFLVGGGMLIVSSRDMNI